MTKMFKLPDGSGFFVGTVRTSRDPGFIEWLKYRRNGMARRWLWAWRNYRDARRGFGLDDPPLPVLKALKWAWKSAA